MAEPLRCTDLCFPRCLTLPISPNCEVVDMYLWGALWLCAVTAVAGANELVAAVSSGDADAVQQALASGRFGADDMKFAPPDDPWRWTTVFHEAAGQGHMEIVQRLLAAWPAGAQERDYRGQVPLHRACLNGSVPVAQVLLEKWPEGLKLVDLNDMTVFHYAAQSGSVELVQLLLQEWPEGLKLVDLNDETVFHCAARSGSVELVRLLLQEWPAGLKLLTTYRWTVFQFADSVEVLRLLLQEWPDGWKAQGLDCRLMVEMACNGSKVEIQSFNEAAADLKCFNAVRLSKWHLELWLDNCDGKAIWRDVHGALADRLKDQEAKDRPKRFRSLAPEPSPSQKNVSQAMRHSTRPSLPAASLKSSCNTVVANRLAKKALRTSSGLFEIPRQGRGPDCGDLGRRAHMGGSNRRNKCGLAGRRPRAM